MDANLDTIAKDLYGKIQTRFPDIRIGDEEANVLSKKQDIPKARFFEFEYKEGGDEIGTISVTLDADEGVVLEVSGDIVSKKHPGAFKFIRSFRQFAKDRLLNYDVKRMGKSNLDKRDYAFRSKVKDDMIMENKLFGTSKMSYQDLGEARLIIKHSQQINPELAAGRTMHIENIYIENAMGERFRYPVKHLNGARALAEHIKAGGHPYDGIGQHITSLSEELASLRKFKNYVGRQEQLSEAMGDITSKVMERIDSIKKEIHSLQRPTYYQQFAESFVEHEEQMIPEAVMDDWIDRLTIRTFNEELKGVFPYIYKLVDESELPVRELTPDDLLDEGTEKINPNAQCRSCKTPYGRHFRFDPEGDPNGKITSTTIRGLCGRVPQDFPDLYTTAIQEETLPWETDDEAKEREGGKKEKSPFKKPHNPNRTGSDTAKALAQKGIPKKEGFDPEQAFENFMNNILPEDGAAIAALGGIFDPQQRPGAVAELNNIFKTELKGGPDGMNLNKVKELIPDPEFSSMLDHLSGTGDLDLRSGIEVILNQMSEHNKDLADLIQAGDLQFSSPGGSDMPVGGQDMPEPEAGTEAPPAEAPPAEAPPVAESMGMGKLKAKLIRAVECGAGPDTQLDFGSRKMSLMSALQECGIDPSSIGMKPRSSDGNGVQEILKSISGFWNRDATITEGNFTKGGTWTKQHVVSNFKNGEYKHATKEDVSRVLAMIEKMDPSSDAGGLNRMKQMAGISQPHGTNEGPEDGNFEVPDEGEEDGNFEIPDETNQTSSNNQTGTIDGKSANYADAMAKFRNMVTGMGFDGSSPEAMQKSIQGKLGGMMKGMNVPGMGNNGQFDPQAMMKGIQGKMPQGKMELPGGMGNLDPNAMMQQIMGKMNGPTSPGYKSNNSGPTKMNGPTSPGPDDQMGIYRPGITKSVDFDPSRHNGPLEVDPNMMGSVAPKNTMDFKPGNQSNLLQVDNPEYVARRAAALKKPGAVVGQTTMESNNELASWLKIAGIK